MRTPTAWSTSSSAIRKAHLSFFSRLNQPTKRPGKPRSGALNSADHLDVGLAFGPDIDPAAVEDDLRRLGRTVLFLDESPVFAYKPQLYGTVADGTLLATVADDDTLALPALDTDQATSLLRATPTLTALTTAASGPRRTVTLDPSGAEVISETTDAE